MKKKRPSSKARKPPRKPRAPSLMTGIMTAAARVLVKQGYDAATTHRIAELAGVSLGSLYQYFPNKEALIAALIDDQVRRNLNALETKLKEVERRTLRTQLEILVRTSHQLFLRNRSFLKVLFSQVGQLEKVSSVLAARAHASKIIRRVLERHRSEIRPKNLELAVFVIVNAVMGVIDVAVLADMKGIEEDELTDEMLRLVLGYLGLSRSG